jgi:hypothetical protein
MERNQSKRTFDTNFHKKFHKKNELKNLKIDDSKDREKIANLEAKDSLLKKVFNNISKWFGFSKEKTYISLGDSGVIVQKRNRSKKERGMRNAKRQTIKANRGNKRKGKR